MNSRGFPPSPFFRAPGTVQKVKKGVSGRFLAGKGDDFVNDFNCGQSGQGAVRVKSVYPGRFMKMISMTCKGGQGGQG